MSKKPRGNIHKIREFELEKINLIDQFDILQIVGEGWFGKILLVEHRSSQTEMVLKAVPKPYVSLRDFYREFHYGFHLGAHRNIVTTFDVAFETAGFYVFTQEYAPLGDLTSNVTDTGVGEVYSKRVAKQIASALDYMHSKDIVHRDVKLDNVLIYRSDFSRVKLCDFGESYQAGTIVERRNEWLPYSPPEVLEIKPEGTYKADPSHDVWQFGIVIFVCLTGCLPWQKAASDDPRYVRYLAWQGTMMLPIRRTPKLFKLLSSRAQRMFRRFLEPRSDRRPKSLADLAKFIDDRWLAKTAEKEMAEYETDELCPSMYSFHSSPDEKHRLLYSLADCGIETNVDRQTKKNRIKDWIESSVITEEDEEENEESASASPSSSVSREPVAGHISSIRQTVEKTKEIKSTLKDAAQKHFDPRTGALQQGPSEMGVTMFPASPSLSNMSTMNNDDSLCGSLLTLGSRQDLIASSLQMYNSDVNLNRRLEGKLEYADVTANERFLNPSLSSGNLLTAEEPPNIGRINQRLPIGGDVISGNGGGGGNSQRKILQRSKSDSLKAAMMFASSPAIDSLAQTTNPTSNGKLMKSVTFLESANTSRTLESHAPPPPVVVAVAAPNASMQRWQQQHQQQQQQQPQQPPSFHYFNRQQNDSQVKDSGYGSTEISETSPPRFATTIHHQANGGGQKPQPVTSSVRTQSSQQQRVYRGAQTASMKDTAYDRVAVTNNGNNKRR